MGLTFLKSKPAVAPSNPSTAHKSIDNSTGAETSTVKTGVFGKPAASSGKVVKPSFMKTGTAAKAEMDAADARAEKAREDAGRMFRFWMPPGEERTVTFLDGALGDDGMLDWGMFYEHRVQLNGEWTNLVCTAETEPCPICARGDAKQSLVGAGTILDHTPYKVKNGPNAGKVLQHTRKLFVPTRNTIKILSKQAVKRGGLAGCTFEISRGGDKDPSVGSQFEFVEKRSLQDLMATFGLTQEQVAPADYAHEIVYRSAEDLISLGAGQAPKGPGYEKAGINKGKLANEL